MKRWPLAAVSIALAGAAGFALRAPLAADFDCTLGDKISADLGDGVVLHSCSWEKTPGSFVRTGPLHLVRNDILILQLYTDRDGKLQGDYRSWSDAGVLIESGQYDNGLKEGEWRRIDSSGRVSVVVFRSGKPVRRESR